MLSLTFQPYNSSSHTEELWCRICHEGEGAEKLFAPCHCTGSVGWIHMSCLEKWLQYSQRTECELCGYNLPVEKVALPLTKFFFSPSSNPDFSNLACDAICFMAFTPMLVASTLLCLRGANHYMVRNQMGSFCALVVLVVVLQVIFVAWLVLVILHHLRMWGIWRQTAWSIRFPSDKMANKTAVRAGQEKTRGPPCYQQRPFRLTQIQPYSSGTLSCSVPTSEGLSSWDSQDVCRVTTSYREERPLALANPGRTNPSFLALGTAEMAAGWGASEGRGDDVIEGGTRFILKKETTL